MPEKRFALLIDADNVSAKYLKPIMDELSKYGTVTYKRIYGDWTLAMHSKWKNALLENSITPIQQFGYTQGKNATDSAMIIDAMDILYTHSVEGFCIVSSDSDFTRLAARIRESGLTVIGMGEQKTPTPFRRACDIFTTLELLAGEKSGKRKADAGLVSSGAGEVAQPSSVEAVSIASKEEIERAVVDIITDNQNNGKATGLGEVGSRLLKRYPDFDVRSYGTNLLSKLLDDFSSVKITKDGSNVAVELAETPDVDAVASEEAVVAEEALAAPDAQQEERKSKRPRRRRKLKAGAKVEAKTEPGLSSEPDPNLGSDLDPDSDQKPEYDSIPDSAPDSVSQQDSEPVQESEPEAIANRAQTALSPQAFILDRVQAAGEDGIVLTDLSRRVKSKFRAFRVTELGFRNFRSFVQSLDGVQIEKREGTFVAFALRDR